MVVSKSMILCLARARMQFLSLAMVSLSSRVTGCNGYQYKRTRNITEEMVISQSVRSYNNSVHTYKCNPNIICAYAIMQN